MQNLQQTDVIADLLNRIRAIEGKYAILGEQLLVVNENTIDSYKDLTREVKVITSEIKEIKQDLFNLKETMKRLLQETEMFARKEQLKVLEKYINLWNPMDFITAEELNKILKDKSESKTGGKSGKKRGHRKSH